jgi:hypothetical protein
MATATRPQIPVSRVPLPAIVHPLVRLRRAIRSYVVVEGLALAVSLACIWFWIVFLMDWGTFALLGVDYLRDSPAALHGAVRIGFLGVLAVGLLAVVGYKVFYRLIATFNQASLALVLERRFPGILGDRLVTAVELADLEAAERYGYSPVMVEATARAAAERVDQVALRQVFNWSRLGILVAISAAMLMSVILVALLATDTFARWVERDVLLEDAYWPRPTLLELPDFRTTDSRAVPHGGELRVPIYAWKWIVATRQHPEGWRPLAWSDLLPEPAGSRGETKPWELKGADFTAAHYQALPDAWRALALDQVEGRIHQAGSDHSPETQTLLTELGLAVIEQARGQIRAAQQAGQTQLDADTLALLPDAWHAMPLEQLDDYLRASRVLTPSEVVRLQRLLTGNQLLSSDTVQVLNAAFSPVPPPVFSVGLVQQLADPQAAPLMLSESDRELLPRDWRKLPHRTLQAKLQELSSSQYAPEQLGDLMRRRLLRLFEDLNSRAAQSHIGRRCWFRSLTVPDEVTVEFEQLLTDEERGHVKPRLGKPKVRRQLGSNEFVYDFKKVDRALRFRVLGGGTATPWYQIDVKELPTLRKLTRKQTELGYLHGSNERVPLGPFTVSLEGDESQLEVPAGTRLEFEAECQKPLRWVRLGLPNQQEHQLWAKCAALGLGLPGQGAGGPAHVTGSVLTSAHVERSNPFVKALSHQPDTASFSFALHELAGEDLKLQIEFEDGDGIIGGRKVSINVLPDREPEFKKAQPEVVKRKMITPLAVIPFSGHIHDDHGLLGLNYEVAVEGLDRKPVRKAVFPLRQFRPLRFPEAGADELVYEKRTEVTPGRLLAGAWGEAVSAGNSLSALPLLGPLAWAQPPRLEVPTDYVFEFRVRPGNEPVLNPADEFFDTLLLREKPDFAQPAQSSPAPLAVPYRVTVRLAARDNRVRSGPDGKPQLASQDGRSPETFDFTVVSEEELLIENGKKEEDLRDRCEGINASITKGRMTILKRLREDFDGKFEVKEGAYDFRRAAADAQDMHKLLVENQQSLDNDVARAFREIYRELVLNRCKEQILERIDKKICRPLEATLLPGQHFARAEEGVELLARRLEMEKQATPRVVVEDAIERTDQLIRRLDEILSEMKKLIEFNQALKVLQEIIDKERAIIKAAQDKEKEEKKKELQPDK